MSSAESSKRPHASAFKQQQLPAWTPILTPKVVIITFFAVGLVFVPLGILFLSASSSIVQVSSRYDDTCGPAGNSSSNGNNTAPCLVSVTLDKDMAAPVYLYYQLDNFYQNHRRYVKSRSDAQLRGDEVSESDVSDCEPRAVNQAGDVINPCGLIAASQFSDVISLYSGSQGSQGSQEISLRKEGIAWRSDVEKKFAAGTDEDLIVWMRTAGLPSFKKLYRIVDADLPAGEYHFSIQNNYPVDSFSGKKRVVLSTANWLGGKNDFLGIAYITVGSICIVLAIAFAVKHAVAPRKIGDTKWLVWHKNRQAQE